MGTYYDMFNKHNVLVHVSRWLSNLVTSPSYHRVWTALKTCYFAWVMGPLPHPSSILNGYRAHVWNALCGYNLGHSCFNWNEALLQLSFKKCHKNQREIPASLWDFFHILDTYEYIIIILKLEVVDSTILCTIFHHVRKKKKKIIHSSNL